MHSQVYDASGSYIFTPIAGVTTYNFVVIGAGGGARVGNTGGNGGVVTTTYIGITEPLSIFIGGGGGSFSGYGGGSGGGLTQIYNSQVQIIAGGGGGGANGANGGNAGNSDGSGGGGGVSSGKGGKSNGDGGAGGVAGSAIGGAGGTYNISSGNGFSPGGGYSVIYSGGGGASTTQGGTIGNGGSTNSGGGGGVGAGGAGAGVGSPDGDTYGGGGGAGYGGGGGGGNGGGGGGSSFASPSGQTGVVYSVAPYVGSTNNGLGGNQTNNGSSAGLDGYVLITWDDPIPIPKTHPTSNICFLAGTPITTDQGDIAIDQIDTTYHTIDNKRILDITQTVSIEKFLVRFPQNCLGDNYPSADTIMTKDHKVMYENKLYPAYKFLNFSPLIKRVKYTGEILYNVLQEKHELMRVNNLVCETLHPDNLIAKIYKNRFSDDYNERVIHIMNESLNKRKLYEYKSIINRIHSETC